MVIHSMVLLCSLGVAANEKAIDAFQYADSGSAREAWVAGSDTPPVEMVQEGGRRVLQFRAPFETDPKLPRTVLDRKVKLDLAGAGEFTLEIAVDNPRVAGHLSLYFQSGSGWYASGAAFVKEGWQTLRFSKASFRVEGNPAGWHQIDGVRISIWRGQPADFTVRLGRLAARWHDVALVIPAAYRGRRDREAETARRTADDVGSMLAELGLGSDAVEDAALPHGVLGDRRVAILAYNPRLGDEAVAALEQFIEQGGKVFACYTVPPSLAQVLGISAMKRVEQERSGQFAEIRFEADVPGLPDSVRQASWNVNVPQSLAEGTRVIGRWFDDEGKPTGQPALLLSDKGAFMTHIVLTDDRSAKKQMLAAILGQLHPPLWRQMAQSALDRAGQVGHLQDVDAVAQYVQAAGDAQARAALARGRLALDRAKESFDNLAHPGPKVVQLAGEAREELLQAYFRSAPSPAIEGRACWNHSGTGAYPGDWERTAKELSEAGFNMVIPNLLWAGRAHYPSDVLPRSKTYEEYGDQIAQCVAACHKYGVEVHVWKVNHNLSGAPRDFVDKLRREGRLQKSVTGEEQRWLCPSHPENFKLELESMLEVARKYDVDGLHFDYIRYPNGNCCYCDGCRERFESDTGLHAENWPKDCYSGSLHDAYHDWRCRQITRLVAAVHREAKRIKPGIKISAAVFGAYPQCRESVGQDWVAWVQAGYLDFICPMDYTQSDMEFTSLVENQLRLVDRRIPVYPGIGAWRLTPDRVVGQIHHARSLGAAGFTIFNLTEEAAATVLPAVGLGAGSHRATPPHSARETGQTQP